MSVVTTALLLTSPFPEATKAIMKAEGHRGGSGPDEAWSRTRASTLESFPLQEPLLPMPRSVGGSLQKGLHLGTECRAHLCPPWDCAHHLTPDAQS